MTCALDRLGSSLFVHSWHAFHGYRTEADICRMNGAFSLFVRPQPLVAVFRRTRDNILEFESSRAPLLLYLGVLKLTLDHGFTLFDDDGLRMDAPSQLFGL